MLYSLLLVLFLPQFWLLLCLLLMAKLARSALESFPHSLSLPGCLQFPSFSARGMVFR
jgi:hypothetical protein